MKKKMSFAENGKLSSLIMMVVALALFIGACTATGWLSVLLHVLWVLALCVGFYLLYLGHRHDKGQICYFLYDRRRKLKIKKENLQFHQVEDNLLHYLKAYIKTPLDLWDGVPKSLQIETDAHEGYRPLFSYLAFYALSPLDDAEILDRFDLADEETVCYFCNAIADAGDEDMAELVYKMKRNILREERHIVAFFKKNRRVFEGRMVRFVLAHTEAFLVDKNSIT